MSEADDLDLSAIAIFPLPGVVLLPRAILPLHIFEDRYRAMTADALDGSRLIAMALLKPGWEKSYYARPAIEPTVCVGRILSHEHLADGKYNFLLQGAVRASIVRELPIDKPYRIAALQALESSPIMEIDVDDHRRRLTQLLTLSPLVDSAVGGQFRQIIQSSLTTGEIADLAAFHFIEDVQVKYSLLAEADVLKRIGQTVRALETASKTAARRRQPSDPHLN